MAEVFLNVAHQRRLLDKRRLAVGTQMPWRLLRRRFLVAVPRPPMDTKIVVGHKLLPAVVTLEWSLVGVPPLLMQAPILRPCEPPLTERAGIRRVVGVVTPDVLLKVALLCERHTADVTRKRGLSGVNAEMDLQGGRPAERSPTELADMRPAAGVTNSVVQQMLVPRKTPTADIADERS